MAKNNVVPFEPWMPAVDTAVDDSPEQASRSVDIAKATGADPAAVMENLEPTERNLKQNLSHQIVQNDPAMQKWIMMHPIVPKLANDDLGAISQAGDSFHKAASVAGRSWWSLGAAGMARGIGTGAGKTLSAFGRMIGSENLVGVTQRIEHSLDRDIPLTDEEKERMPHLVGEGLGQIMSLLLGAAAGGVPGAALQMGLQTGEEEATKAEKKGGVKIDEATGAREYPTEALEKPDWQTPFTGGFTIGTAMGMVPLGTLEKIASKAGPGISGFIKQRLVEALSTGAALTGASEAGAFLTTQLEKATFDPEATYSPELKRMVANMIGGAILGPTVGSIKSFIDRGLPIPIGAHPLTDAISIEKTKIDNDALDQALKDAGATQLKDRQPAFLAAYFKFHPNATIGVDGSKVLELYGNKPPGPGDGILGDVAPNIEAQLKTAAADGSDIQIPMADYVAKIDPKIDKELHDFRRVDANGLTLDDVKNFYAAPGGEAEGGVEVPPVLKAEEPRVGAVARSGDPTLDAARAQMGLDKIIPMPALHVYDYTPGPRLLPKGVTLDGPAIKRDALGQDYTVLKEMPSRDMLRMVDRSGLQGVPKTLYQFFGDRLDKLVGDVPLQIVTVPEMKRIYSEIFHQGGFSPAFYWHGKTTAYGDRGPRIVMTDTMAQGMLGQDYATHAIIHEMAHAASVRAMMSDPKLAGDLIRLREETRKWIQTNDPDQLDNTGVAYAFKDPQGYEFVAQAYSEPDFQNILSRAPLSKDLANELGHPGAKTLWEAARNLIKKALEKIMGVKLPPTVLDGMFTMGERFEAAMDSRKPELKPIDTYVSDDLPTPEERQLFQDQKALGYTKDHWNRIKDKIAKQRAEDNEFQQKQAMKDAARRQTENWKQNAADMRPDAQNTVYSRPAVRADRFLRLGILDGSKITRQRLDGSKLDPGVRDQLSPEWYNKAKGLAPDDVAGILGYRSGDAMISDLILMNSEMKKAGMTHDAFIKKRIDDQVDTMMNRKFGNLQDRILEDAKDHIISDGQFDLLHEDTLRLASKFGFEAPFNKDQVKTMARADFESMRQGDVKSHQIADNTGRIGRKIENAENKGDAKEVMKLAQQRELSYWKVREAREFEKDQDKFYKIAKNHRKREPTAFKEPEAAAYHDFIQLLLGDVGEPINRKYEDVKNEFGEKGFKSFRDFVADREKLDEFIPAPEWILAGEHQKAFEDFTVGEAKSYMNLVTALDKLGRERFTVNTDYGRAQLEPVLNQMVDNIAKQYDIKDRSATGEREGVFAEINKASKYYWVGSRIMERILSRLDMDNPRGAFNQYVVRPVTEGMNRYETFKRKWGKQFRELGPPEDMGKTLDAPFKVPSTGRDFTSFTRKNLITIMLNMGSTENWTKFTEGWKVDPGVLEAWIHANATEADWKWVTGVWRLFDDIKKDLDGAYRRTTGTPPGTKDFRTIDTRWGQVKGGYYPLVHDAQEIGKGSRTNTYEVNSGPSFFQQNIPNPHAKEVTGAIYPISMDLDRLPGTFDKIIFDIAMREPLHEVKKILTDKKLLQDVNNRMGKEYTEAIDSWLHDVSHAAEYNTAAGVEADRVSQFFRQNVIGYLVGANISTVLKHFSTAAILSFRQEPKYILKAYATLFKANPTTGDRMWKWISENSEEIQRRDRFWQETFGGVYKDFTQSTIRDHIISLGSKPVAFSDMLSAKPVWLAAFMKAQDAGMDFGESRFEADRAVRFAHGSTAISNLPQIARGRGINSWFTSLYGFFGTVLQNRMEIAYKANDIYRLGRQGELAQAAKIMPLMAADIFAYVIAPTAIEEWVTGLTTDDRRGWGQHAAWATAAGLANSFIGFRDLTHMLEYGLNDSGGLLSSAVKPFTRSFHDVTKPDGFSKEQAGNLIEDVLALSALRYGTPKELGNLSKYGWNTMVADKETPYTGVFENWNKFGDLGMGLFRGSQKKSVRK